jgi:hypothetical protein
MAENLGRILLEEEIAGEEMRRRSRVCHQNDLLVCVFNLLLSVLIIF